jgi:acyl-CoA synthetase (NDP forming)
VALVALTVRRPAQARAATVSHTASLAVHDSGAAALMARLGIARVDSLATLLEALKLLHVCGPLRSNRVASISCSGGEASLMADLGAAKGLVFPALDETRRAGLRAALGPRVALANPLDYNTYIWRDAAAMTRAWAALMAPDLALTFAVVDYPRDDTCDPTDWACATEAAKGARAETGSNVAVLASLPELMPEAVAGDLMAAGVVPMNGMVEALEAAAVAAWLGAKREAAAALLLPVPVRPAVSRGEVLAKAALAGYGADVPRGIEAATPEAAAEAAGRLGFPVVLKGQGFDHKTEAGAVALGLGSAGAVRAAARAMPAAAFLVEEMIGGAVAELIVGVVKDPAHGFVLTLGAGGVLAELLEDRACLLVPASEASVAEALGRLKIARVLAGWRGRPGADLAAVVAAVMAVQRLVMDRATVIEEVVVNPLMVTPTRAVAADALLREAEP